MSCGSSSMLVRRMKRPTRVMRLSPAVAWRTARPSSIARIERNL